MQIYRRKPSDGKSEGKPKPRKSGAGIPKQLQMSKVEEEGREKLMVQLADGSVTVQ